MDNEERITSLEQRVASVENQVSSGMQGHTVSRGAILTALLPRSLDTLSWWQHFWPVLLSALSVGLWAFLSRFPISLGVLGLVLNNLPFILGFWVGLRWRGHNTLGHILGGLAVGLLIVISFVAFVAALIIVWGEQENVQEAIVYSLLYYAVGPVLLYTSGGILGDLAVSWIRRQQTVIVEAPQPVSSVNAPKEGRIAIIVALIGLVGAVLPTITWLILAGQSGGN